MPANPLTTKWKPLEADLGEALKKMCGRQSQFFGSHAGLPGLPRDAFQSDGLLASAHACLALEVECTQNHPDTNVSKYWLLLETNSQLKQLVVVHVFTPAYTSYPWRMKLAEFIAGKLSEAHTFSYELCDHRSATDYATVRAAALAKLTAHARALGLTDSH